MRLLDSLFGPNIGKFLEEEQYDEIKKLVSTDKNTMNKLIQQLGSRHTRIRERAANLLGDMNEARAIPSLLSVIKRGIKANRPINLSYEYDVSKYLAVDRYIDTKGYERRIPLFDWLFQDYKGSDKLDVSAASKALSKIIYSSDFEPLLAALKDINPEVRERSAEVLMRRGGEMREPYIGNAIKELITVSEQDEKPMVRRYARLALRNMGTKIIEPLIATLKDENPDRRISASWTLYWVWNKYNDMRAILPLITAVEEKDVAVVAGAYYFFLERGEDGTQPILIEALNQYGHRSKEMVTDYLNCGEPQLRKAAEQWAHTHGYYIKPSEFGGHRGWGSKRPVYKKRDTKG